MKHYLFLIVCLCLWTSCQKADSPEVIEVDLNDKEQEITYSGFVKSMESVSLYLADSVPINGIGGLYFDDGKIFVRDSGSEGILVFDEASGRLLRHFHPFGEGPEEIKRIGAFCLDFHRKQMRVFDSGDWKLKVYDYAGNYVSSDSAGCFLLDMVMPESGGTLCFYPVWADGTQRDGVWLVDSLNRFRKQLDASVTEECRFHYFPMQYNRSDTCVYYYDRNRDVLSVITADTLRPLYTFHIRQAIPLSKKGMLGLSPYDLDGHAIVHHFACSDRFILLSLHTFHHEDMAGKYLTWLLLDRRTGKTMLSEHLTNDLLPEDEIEGKYLFYKDNHTWVRADDSEENVIRLEVMHLRNGEE